MSTGGGRGLPGRIVTGGVVTEMEFCLLGPLEVRRGGTAVPVQAGKQQAVLAALLLNAGRVVSLEELAEMRWGPAPPPSARVTMQNYIKRLRQALGDAGGSRIGTRPLGYVLRVQPGELDLDRFGELLGEARAAARDGSWDTAAAQARAALALWRGEPLAGVDSEVLAEREGPRLAELRLEALEARIGAELRLGRHAEVIAELRHLASAHPLREHLHAMLMLALYRDGRQAAALAVYTAARQVLVAELGIEPGPELRDLHQQMLTANPALELPGPGQPAGGAGRVVPRELPAGVRHFTGRAGELAALTELLDQPGEQRPGMVVLSAICGTAGVGKTALAVHWAHQVAGRFPDGQLYVNLRGYDPGPPVPAADALAGFLRALGVPGAGIPPGETERSARYRSLLAGKRMLVVLDNAGSAEQVRPLLPGTPSCAVVVTSRDALAGLVARDGAARLDLDALPITEAVGLLRALIGDRVDAAPAAAEALAGQCCRLPLALRVAAELAADRPASLLAELADELSDQQRRLDLLNADRDPRTAIRAVFSWSYHHLDVGAARTFRLAALHPGPDLEHYAAAALTDTTTERAERTLDMLTRGHLIQPARPGRYGMHDLLRAYARDLAGTQDTAAERRAALTRLFDHYLHTATAAMDTLFPAEQHHRPRIPPPATPAPQLSDPTAARDWLDSQRSSLVAVAMHAAHHGWPGHATRLAVTLFRYLEAGGHYPEAIIIHSHARRAARHTGDHDAEMAALNALGLADLHQGRCQQATDHFQHALALCREAGDRSREARALGNLGTASLQQGSYRQATGYYQQALTLHRETGELADEANVLVNLSIIDHRQGRCQQATGRCQQAIALAKKTGDRDTEAYALLNLGIVDLRLGRCQRATNQFQRALTAFCEIGNRSGEAAALTKLGDVGLKHGHHQQATDHLQQALIMFRMMGDGSGEAEARNGLGEVLLATGQPGDGSIQHTAALDLAGQVGDNYEEARAYNGLGHTCQASGDSEEARRHWRQALALYASLGTPEADQVRAQLTASA